MTVIGWAWIVIGGLACLASALALPAMATSMTPRDAGAGVFPALAIVQLAVGVTGLVSGIQFLKLRPWSRVALEILTWLLLALLLGSAALPFLMVGSGPSGIFFGEIIIMVMISGIYIVPLGIMLAYLRGKKVKGAFAHSTEAVDVISGKPPSADG